MIGFITLVLVAIGGTIAWRIERPHEPICSMYADWYRDRDAERRYRPRDQWKHQ